MKVTGFRVLGFEVLDLGQGSPHGFLDPKFIP